MGIEVEEISDVVVLTDCASVLKICVNVMVSNDRSLLSSSAWPSGVILASKKPAA